MALFQEQGYFTITTLSIYDDSRFVAILGIISAAITIRDKEISGMLKLGGIMINIMPLLGSVIAK